MQASADVHTALQVIQVTDLVFPLPKPSCMRTAVSDRILQTFLIGKLGRGHPLNNLLIN